MRWNNLALLRRPEDEGGAAAPTNTEDNGESAREAFSFDPSTFFVPPAKEGSGEGEGGTPDGGASSAVPSGKDPAVGAASPAGSTPPSPTPDPAPPGGDDPLAALRASVSELLSKKPEAPKAETTPPPAAPQKQETQQTPKEAAYDFQLPIEVVDALGSDEPATRGKALNSVVNGVANRLAKDFGSAMAELAKHVQQQAVEAAVQRIESQNSVKTVREDFYSTFKDIKELVDQLPALDQVVWATANTVAQQAGAQGWTPQLRDQVGAMLRLQLRLPVAASAPGQTPPAAPAGRPPAKAPFSAGGGTQGRPNGKDPSNEFLDVVFAGGT